MKDSINIRIFTLFLCSSVFLCSAVFAEAADSNSTGVERYAIYIGSNSGGKNNSRLLYAGTDAMSFQKTMSEIGGVPECNSILLLDPSKENVDDALSAVSNAIVQGKSVSRRTEFIFYYSGHSDENALLLGKSSYEYSQLKESISNVPSDVHVVILDSCYSGNFIRTKGGQRKKPFLMDDSTVVKGHAYLSSSSALESSQESDEIGSSFFTNAMLTGLRGAADTSGDNKVSLNELYSYAFNDTLARTESSSAGPQHPNYNITLVGSGDLILSDISASESALMIPEEMTGKIIIRDSFGKLISEINKTEKNPVYFALSAGTYTAVLITETDTLQGTFLLKKNQLLKLDRSYFNSVIARTENRLRGDETVNEAENSAESEGNGSAVEPAGYSGTDTALEIRPFHFAFAGNNSSRTQSVISIGIIRASDFIVNGAQASLFSGNVTGTMNGAQASLIGVDAGVVNGIQGAGIYASSQVLNGVQASGIFNRSGTVNGVQGTGIFNQANSLMGVQGSGIFNTVQDGSGIQAAGLFNCARTMNGIQAAGLFNISGTIRGVQAVGVVNVAKKVTGVQVGLINVAEENNGVALGLINIIRNGVHDAGMMIDTNGNIFTQIQSGTNHLFTTALYGSSPRYFFSSGGNDYYHFFALGLGTRFNCRKVSFDIEALFFNTLCQAVVDIGDEIHDIINKYEDDGKSFSDDASTEDKDRVENLAEQFHKYAYPSLRFSVSYNLLSHFSLFATACVDVRIEDWNDEAFDYGNRNLSIDFTAGSNDVTLYPSFGFGVKIR
ncbi:MAG: caspase family protein [Treponema porcinum]|uniref:caspase family protein n=1 Tax=Treponema porcinum TaxID=261392 RepID=UPI0023544118|nr:caspase family protein [Treponema porcinum]MCI7080763.1 caspase family protein [Treponema porcinum]MCI7534769.1 caspase family protein [Treponema porcinum]MDY4189351.1 caspase family protein [Treponema porcinum]MDY5049395.1 caspase family protein [Treponema porcinum]